MRHKELNAAIDNTTWLIDWEYTPRWIVEILRLFRRQLERRI